MNAARPGVVLAEVAVLVMALIWGVNYSVIKYGMTFVSPMAYNTLRVILAAVVLFAIARAFGGAWPSRRDTLTLLALGVLGNGLYQMLFAEGVSRTRAGEAALVVGASPALIALFGRLKGVERVTTRGVIGISLSIFGVGLVVLGRAASGPSASDGSLLGDLLVLAGSVCWAVYTVYLIPFTTRVSGLYVVALSLLGGSAFLLVIGAPALLAQDWHLPARAWMALVYSGIGALVIAYLLWYRGVKVLGATRTAMYANLQPIIALMVAWLTLGERPTSWQVVGAATIVGGVILTRVPASEAS
ncbi:MAG TPA: DMT family transporter [Gemmatimonadaceae bacterium]|nr:DMT family transporter [Gemmatimonadaceae bacterium]